MQFNQSQQAAIETDAKNVVVISGPGSGKTRVLVARLAKLLERGVDPGKITVITYTNAAADEIQQRLVQSADLRRQDAIKKCDERAYEKAEADKDSKLGYCGTLHGWCMKFLRRHAEQVGFAAAITVLDEEQSEALLEQTAAKLRYKGPKGELARCVRAIHELPSSKSPARFVALDYYNAMLGNGMVDFDGILYWTLAALCKGVAEDPVHLLVDEMQDCSRADHMIFNRMAADSRFYLADPDQSIFGFRGGDGRLVDVLARMPRFSVLTLAENYRCAEEICAAANKLIAHNPGRRPKETVSQTGSEGELCMWTNLPSPAHEQAVIA
jgi:DNA helicase-2/ATP-dependent DNA helicase PcrA